MKSIYVIFSKKSLDRFWFWRYFKFGVATIGECDLNLNLKMCRKLIEGYDVELKY
jgi:hypothetical protein